MTKHLLPLFVAAAFIAAAQTSPLQAQTATKENLIICDEGTYQSDNGQLSFYDGATGTATNQWFRAANPGKRLGQTPNDIIQLNDTLIAVCVNGSNLIQFIRTDGTACGATEDVPNCRRMCTDGKGNLYVTSYAHQLGSRTFTKGFVARIDIATKTVTGACEVGWEPEGVRYYDGRLYVANTGGYSYSEKDHDYEKTVSVVDATAMTLLRDITTEGINLYGNMVQAGKYICVNASGDYYTSGAKTIIIDCETEQQQTYNFPSTYPATDGKLFYTVGSVFSYEDYSYTWYINTIDPAAATVTEGVYGDAVTEKIKSLKAPYEVYVSPYTKNLYFTDANDYTTEGSLYGYTSTGENVIDGVSLYVNPAHILALPPAGTSFTGISVLNEDGSAKGAATYNLAGQRVDNGYRGVVIRGGKKVVRR